MSTSSRSAAGSKPSSDGRRVAQLFRQSRDLQNTRAPDLDAILEEDNLVLATSQSTDPGYAACLMRRANGNGGGIMLAADQDTGRRRFSLAHELGHYHIPNHKKLGNTLSCADADLRARNTDLKTMEWEANDFAAELLMPTTLFAKDLGSRSISFHTVERLAGSDMYNVSRTAAAWRVVQTTREACALVVTVEGKVQWVARSDAFRYSIPERNQTVGAETVAAAVARGEEPNDVPEIVDPPQWLDSTYDRNIEVLESTLSIPSLQQVLSLVWVVDGEC